MTLNQRRTFLVAFDGVLVASRMYVATFALLSCYERVFITKKIAYFMISELWTFGLQNLFVRTLEPVFSNLRTFGLNNLRTYRVYPQRLVEFKFGPVILREKRTTTTFHDIEWISISSAFIVFINYVRSHLHICFQEFQICRFIISRR